MRRERGRGRESLHVIDLFEGTTRGLGEEQVDGGYHESVDDGEDGVRVVSNRVKCDWCDEHNQEVRDPL